MIRVGFELHPDAARLRILLDCLVRLNLLQLKRHRLPSIYKAGVKYKREPLREEGDFERWKTTAEILRDGEGDCEDLACARVAELRWHNKIRAVPWLIKHGNTWHVVVKHPDNHIEDPSARLGMRRVRR
jgi:hypothetical protein